MQHFSCFLPFTMVLWLLSCTAPQPEAGQAAGKPDSTFLDIMAEKPQVLVAPAERKPFAYRIETRGRIESARSVPLTFQKGGLVAEVKAQSGDRVAAGQLLAQLDQSEERIALQRAENELLVRQDDYYLLVKEYQMLQGDTNTRNEAQIRSQLANSGLGAARIELAQAKLSLDNTLLHAPFSGVLADFSLQPGNRVGAGEEVGILYDPASLIVEVEVLEADFSLLRKGQPAQLEVLAFPGKQFPATIKLVEPFVQDNGLLKVLVAVSPTAQGQLLPGMNAKVTLQVPLGLSLVMPKPAVVLRSGREVVFTVVGGKAKWHYVAIGRDNGQEVEILEGLPDTATSVIVSNNLQLGHDAEVEVILGDVE